MANAAIFMIHQPIFIRIGSFRLSISFSFRFIYILISCFGSALCSYAARGPYPVSGVDMYVPCPPCMHFTTASSFLERPNVRSARFLMQNNSSVFAKRFHFPTQWALWAWSLRAGQINAKIGHLLSGARWCAFFSAPLIIPRRHGTIGETELRGVMEVSLPLFFCLLLMENRGGRVGTWHSIPSQLSLRSYTSSSAASS